MNAEFNFSQGLILVYDNKNVKPNLFNPSEIKIQKESLKN